MTTEPEPEKPRRGRPREEYWHKMADLMPGGLFTGKPSTRKLKDVLARGWLQKLFEPGANVSDPGYKPPLPRKVVTEIGRLFFVDDEVLEMAQELHGGTDEATLAELRTQILERLPSVRELYERALMLKSKGWGSGVIAADIRRLRLKLTHTESRAAWEAKFDRAVNALYLAAQDRAQTLSGPQGDTAALTRRLLEDALTAAV